MSAPPALDRLETDRLVLRRREVGEAGIYRQLWTERDPRVPARRRINADGRPTVEDITEQLRSAQGSGYATEAAQAVVDLAGQAGYPRLWADVWDWNTASRRVLAKLGFRETGQVTIGDHGESLQTRLEL